MVDQESLGREYFLHEELGRGAFAVVRRATSRFGGPPLAAKLLRPELAGDRRVRDLFLREEAALRDLEHRGIVSIRDLVVERGQLALLMEFVDGPNLRRHLADRGGRLPARETAAIAAQAAGALAVAHAHGVVHLDLKPENLLLVRGSDPPEVRISDFGVAALLLDADHDVLGGTPGYTAPELLLGGPPTAAADVYSLGVILVELVTGALPAPGAAAGLPAPLAELAEACLADDPRSRPSARSVAARLRAAVTASPAEAPAPAETPAPPVERAIERSTVIRTPAPVEQGPPLEKATVTGRAAPVENVAHGGRNTRLRRGAIAPPPPEPPDNTDLARRPRGPVIALAAALVAVVVAVLIGLNMTAAANDRANRSTVIGVVPTSAAAPATESQAPIALPPTVAVADRTRATFAGHVAGGGGTLAISLRDGVAIAYICDGKRVEAWLKGTARAGRLALTGKQKAKITGTFDAGRARGSVTVDGKTRAFTLTPVQKPSGLYRTATKVRNAQVVGSWIVLPDGRQVGVLTRAGAAGPAPVLDTRRRITVVDGMTVGASTIDADSGEGF
jgi:serine/threonine protein kinase, bacterial